MLTFGAGREYVCDRYSDVDYSCEDPMEVAHHAAHAGVIKFASCRMEIWPWVGSEAVYRWRASSEVA